MNLDKLGLESDFGLVVSIWAFRVFFCRASCVFRVIRFFRVSWPYTQIEFGF